MNRIPQTEAGGAPEAPGGEAWSNKTARDASDDPRRAPDETAVSRPLAAMAKDSPPSQADAMAKPLSAMASGIFMYLPSGKGG